MIKFFFFVVFMIAACSSKEVVKKETKPAKKFYTNAQYIFGNGEGVNAEAAEKKAISEVMRQIESTITADTEIEEKIIKLYGVETMSFKYLENIKIFSEFKRGELIHVDKKNTACGTYGCSAVAYLNRSEAFEAMQPELKMVMQQFNESIMLGRSAVDAGKLEDFAIYYREAKERSAAVMGIARQIRAIIQRSIAEVDVVLSGLAAIEKAAAEFREQVSFILSVGGGATSAYYKPVANWLAQAMMRLGLRNQFGNGCGKSGVFNYFLAAEIQESYDKVPLGEVAQLTLTYRVIRCADGSEVVKGSHSSEGLKGFHTKDAKFALKRAYEGLKKDTEIVSMLRDTLSKIVPLK